MQVYDLITNAPIKSSALDSIPADFFKSCLSTLLPVLSAIVNYFLQSRIFPDHLKQAQLSPILKKFNLDPDTLNNYCPISNLPFVSKLVEKAVVKQPTAYMTENNLFEPYQSTYHSHHSTESALLCLGVCPPVFLTTFWSHWTTIAKSLLACLIVQQHST